jgi:membrane protease YdiL (CAAX protease family)
MKMLFPGRKVFYFLILFIIPLLLWIIPNENIHLITFLSILLLYLISRYWKPISSSHETLEVILLYLTLIHLLDQIGLDDFFPANVLITIILMYIFLILLKKIDRKSLYLTRGNTGSTSGLIILFTALSIVSLAAWFILEKGNPYAHYIPDLPLLVLIPLGIGFAIINAFHEEGLFRSIFLMHFSREISFTGAIVLQSIWFSFLHYQSGFPSGIIGIGLTFVFGLMMGYLVNRTRGLLVPIIIHALADFCIFLLIIFRMKNMI